MNIKYRTIPKSIIDIKKANSVYVFALIKYYEDFKSHISTVTESTLANFSGLTERSIANIISDFKKNCSLFVDINTKFINNKMKRNEYTLKSEYDNFFYVKNDFFKEKLSGILDSDQATCKGLLLKFKAICVNNTNICKANGKLNKTKLAKALQITRPTLDKYLKMLTENNHLKVTDKGDIFINNPHIIPDYVKDDANTRAYHLIYDYCMAKDTIPPERDDKVLGCIIAQYPEPEILATALVERLQIIPTDVNLNYFCKTLRNTTIKRNPKRNVQFKID